MATMLVVDDERDITQVLADFLTMRGHDVTAAQSGKQALSLARQRNFDVVFLDIATHFDISTRTVETHVSSIIGKLDARSRTEAVRKALESGLIR